MAEPIKPAPQGPGKGLFDIVSRIATVMVSIVESRVRLAVIELEEEKANIFQLLLMVGITLILTAVGLMSLLVVVFCAIDPAYRLTAIATTTGVLLLMAVILGAMTLAKAKRSTLLSLTRKQLDVDRALLEKDDEQ